LIRSDHLAGFVVGGNNLTGATVMVVAKILPEKKKKDYYGAKMETVEKSHARWDGSRTKKSDWGKYCKKYRTKVGEQVRKVWKTLAGG